MFATDAALLQWLTIEHRSDIVARVCRPANGGDEFVGLRAD